MTIETNRQTSPAVERATLALKKILGKGLYPTAIPKANDILTELEQEAFQSGFEQALIV